MKKVRETGDIDPRQIIDCFRKTDLNIPVSARETDTGKENAEKPREHPEPAGTGPTAGETGLPDTDDPEHGTGMAVGMKPSYERKEKPAARRRPKTGNTGYRSLFLKESTISARKGKTVYIRKEYHERIQRIIRIITKDEVSLSSYINNVLAHHFDTFQEDIVELYEANNSIF